LVLASISAVADVPVFVARQVVVLRHVGQEDVPEDVERADIAVRGSE
jgi:hypothetical protein